MGEQIDDAILHLHGGLGSGTQEQLATHALWRSHRSGRYYWIKTVGVQSAEAQTSSGMPPKAETSCIRYCRDAPHEVDEARSRRTRSQTDAIPLRREQAMH